MSRLYVMCFVVENADDGVPPPTRDARDGTPPSLLARPRSRRRRHPLPAPRSRTPPRCRGRGRGHGHGHSLGRGAVPLVKALYTHYCHLSKFQ